MKPVRNRVSDQVHEQVANLLWVLNRGSSRIRILRQVYGYVSDQIEDQIDEQLREETDEDEPERSSHQSEASLYETN